MIEKQDLLWALQYACDLARQAGANDLADEMMRNGEDSEEDLRKLFAMVGFLSAGLEMRKLKLGEGV